METKVEKTPWHYHVQVSKDSPKNIKRGMSDFEQSSDIEYYRGYYHPVTYTTLQEAKKALAYFEKGFIEKRRTIISSGYGIGYREQSETRKILVA